MTRGFNCCACAATEKHSRRLDEAVFAAYGWDPAMRDDELLATLLKLNLERAGAEVSNNP